MPMRLVNPKYVDDIEHEQLPIDGIQESDRELLIKALTPSVQAIAKATKVFDQPSEAMDLIEAAIAANKSAINLLCNMENAHDEFFVGRGLSIFKVSNYLLDALNAYDSDTKSVVDALFCISSAHRAIAKAMK